MEDSSAGPTALSPSRLLPGLQWVGHYRKDWLRGDLLAALTIWALVVPQAIAYSQIARLEPQAGLFAAFGGLIGYGLLGTSRQLVVSPTSSTAAISAALVAPLAGSDLTRFAALSATLAIMTGISLALLGLLHMGFISRFIALAVETGFMFGLGLTIILGQVPSLLGISATGDDFFPKAESIIANLGDTNAWTAVIGIGGLGLLLALRRYAPGVPAALVVVLAGIAVVTALDLTDENVAVMGQIDSAIPLPALPAVGWGDLTALLPGALAIAVIGYAESATVAESLAEKHEYDIEPDKELIATGGANVLAGLFQGFMTGGGASQSAANDRAGAQSQLAGLIVAGLVVLTAVALLPLFENLPQAVLGAIVISAVMGFVNVGALKRLSRLRRDSFAMALITVAAVLILGILPGLVLSIALSIVAILNRVSKPRFSILEWSSESGAYLATESGATTRGSPGVLIYRLNAPMLFVNAKRLQDDVKTLLASRPEPLRDFVLDLSFSADLDAESLDVLTDLEKKLSQEGVRLRLANVHDSVRPLLRRSGLADTLGEGRIHRRIEALPFEHATSADTGDQAEPGAR